MLAESGVIQGALTDTAALAAVALIGYLFGRRSRRPTSESDPDLLRELQRARLIAQQLQSLAKRIRADVARHQGSVARFQSEASALAQRGGEDAWQQLERHVEGLLSPSKKLAVEMSSSYDELRRHTSELLAFADSRTDRLCGVHTRRALEEHLEAVFSVPSQPNSRLALALFSVGSAEGDGPDSQLARFAQLLQGNARDADFVARYSADELAIVMPQTSLSGATILGDRLLRGASVELGYRVWGGVVERADSDTPHSLLSRADTALYSARTFDQPCLFQHTGEVTRRCHCSGEPWASSPKENHEAESPQEHEACCLATAES